MSTLLLARVELVSFWSAVCFFVWCRALFHLMQKKCHKIQWDVRTVGEVVGIKHIVLVWQVRLGSLFELYCTQKSSRTL